MKEPNNLLSAYWLDKLLPDIAKKQTNYRVTVLKILILIDFSFTMCSQ